MFNHKSAGPAVRLLALALLLAPSPAIAQASVATREGNIWNWRDHEPRPSEVFSMEQKAGVAASALQRQKNAAEVDRLYRPLIVGSGAPQPGMRQAVAAPVPDHATNAG